MIKCPSCGHENVDGTQFCEMCGEELASVAKAAPGPDTTAGAAGGASAGAGMIKCPACDNLNPPDNVVCEVCGTELKPGVLGGDPATNTAPATNTVPATTPFDTAALSQSTAASTATSAPTPVAADTATATSTDASLPTVSIASADPLSNDPLGGSTTTDTTAPATLSSTAPQTAPVTSLDATPTTLPATTPSAGGALEPGKVKMVVEQGMTIGKQFVLGDAEVLVGREDDQEGIYPDIDLSDQDEGYVHRKHALLKFENGGLSVTHLGGANKTRVNNKPLADNTPQAVNMGDKVAFGKVVMRVQSV